MKKEGRLAYIDNLRSLMIVLVVLMHLNVTYSSMGSWYYTEEKTLDIFQTIMFSIYGTFVQAFFMGLLFFIAGYFAIKSLEKKSKLNFIKDRFMRLIVPALLFMLAIGPLTYYILFYSGNLNVDSMSYKNYIISGEFLSGSGPLWFTIALFIFSMVYLIFWTKKKGREIEIGNKSIISLILAIAIFAFLFRIIWPIGDDGFSFYNFQLGYFSSYIFMFIAGIIVSKNNLLDKLTDLGKRWLKLSLILGFPVWAILLLSGGALENSAPFFSGIHWQSAGYAIWESFFCVSFSLGLLYLFKKKYNSSGKSSKLISDNSFAVYVFHAPIIVAIAVLLKGVELYPLLKMVFVAVIAIPACFGIAYLVRKVPGVKKVF